MRELPARPDLGQLRRMAKDMLRAAKDGEPEALERLGAVSGHLSLAAVQLALAREHGFASWPAMKREVERRQILDARDLDRLRALLEEEPGEATRSLRRWCDHPRGPSPLGYVAMLRYDTGHGVWRDVADSAVMARMLIEAGAPVDGEWGDRETPLITAASYGDAGVAQVLLDAGADLEARATDDAGGVPGGTALLHAAVFGMTDVVDVLVAAGARVEGIEVAAACGDVSGWLDESTPVDARIRALVMAADHERLEVIDELIAAGTPVDAVDEAFGGQPLRQAAGNGRPASVRRLLEHGADPNLQDEQGRTPLELCRRGRIGAADIPAFDAVDAILAPLAQPEAAENPRRATRDTDATVRSVPKLTIEIRGHDLPGRRCGPSPEGRWYENIHVGLARRGDTVELVRGDAPSASWVFDVTVRRDGTGAVDVGGPFVYGARGERALGLRWGTLAFDDTFDVFRAAKLRFDDIEAELIELALVTGDRLVATLGLTDEHGHPVCASVRPPHVTWTVAGGT